MGRLIDLTGQKFGRLTVLKKNFPNDKWGNTRWLCRCSCGTEKVVNKWNLTSRGTKSCGCLGGGKRLSSGLASMRQLIAGYKRVAKNRNLKFELTEKQFFELAQKDCHYCGARPNNVSKTAHHNGEYVYSGIDRVDNDKGYIIGNVVPCCKDCNRAKYKQTVQEFGELVQKIIQEYV